MAAASVPLLDSVDRTELRLICGMAVSEGEVLVSCAVSTPERENLDITRWPKSNKNGLPSKFLPASDRGDVQRLTDLYLPLASSRTLRVGLSSDSMDNWSDWSVLLFALEPESSFPIIWTLHFGDSK
jgi:hypothetical protein